MSNYLIVTRDDPFELAAVVERNLAEGFDLCGGVSVIQHGAGRQLRRIAVVLDVDLKEVRGERGRPSRSVGPLVGAGAEDHRLRLKLAG